MLLSFHYLFIVFDTFIDRLQHPSTFALLPSTFFLSSFPLMLCFRLQYKNTSPAGEISPAFYQIASLQNTIIVPSFSNTIIVPSFSIE